MEDNSQEPLKLVIAGHVDHGKSTFVGRLFHDTGMLPDGKLEQLEAAAERRGVPFEWANLTDALQSERNQNVTIDTAHIWFRTQRRRCVLIDAPGHREFLKNMITGAASADAALLVIDAQEGVQDNSRRHGYLLNLLGIRQIAVLVNKMDLVQYEQARFKLIVEEYGHWLKDIGVAPCAFIPMAAKHGDNVATRSLKMTWWTGPTVLEMLDKFEVPKPPQNQALRFPVQDVYRFDERRILAGRVERGRLKVGDRLFFSPSNKSSRIKSIERWNSDAKDIAEAGESIGITLEEQLFIERGAVAAHESNPPYELTRFKARLFWLGRQPLAPGKFYRLKLATQEAACWIERLDAVIDASSLEIVQRPAEPPRVERHEVAELVLRTNKPLAFDPASECLPMGRFVLVDGLDIAGGGIIVADDYPRRTADSLHKSPNIYWMSHQVSSQQRADRNGHAGCVVWLTGLSCSGKTTLAGNLERELFALGRQVYVLDGDNIRHGLCADLAFTPEDRRENIRRVGEVAKLFADAGVICITAFISPYRADRDTVRASLPPGRFIEVHLNVPVEECEKRDSKGLYAKARAGEIRDFTGVSAPYEPPVKPEITLDTSCMTITACVDSIVALIAAQDAFDPSESDSEETP